MKKIGLKTMVLLLAVSFYACEETVTLSYSESTQGSILEYDLGKTPEENVKIYLGSIDASYSNLKILNKDGANCACTLLGGSCTCKLKNTVGANGGCDDLNSKCTNDKLVQIDVAMAHADIFSSLGFK